MACRNAKLALIESNHMVGEIEDALPRYILSVGTLAIKDTKKINGLVTCLFVHLDTEGILRMYSRLFLLLLQLAIIYSRLPLAQATPITRRWLKNIRLPSSFIILSFL